jgi:hypothetical protein
MATTYYRGYQGLFKFNSTGGAAATVTQVSSWDISIKKEIIETTQQGDTHAKKVGGLISGSGNVELIYTGDNNTLIEAINATEDSGAGLFELYLSSTDMKKISFNGIIESADYGVSLDDVQRIRCGFVTTGPITLDL